MAPQAFPSATKERRLAELVSVDGRTYPLRSAHIRGRAEGGLAQSTLVQEFANPHGEPLEVLYTMPLPADGAVLGYTVRIGERVIRGEIEPRDKAEATYKEALYEGRTAGLLEQDRADTFQQRLGNVPPKTDVRVEIDVLHPLSFLAAADEVGPLWEYRFPTVVGVRYEGAPGRVSDAERLDPNRGGANSIPTRFDINLIVADEVVAGGGITSPSHGIVCVMNSVGVHVTMPQDERLDRDLVLRWPATTAEVGARAVVGGGLPGDPGRYALITITPPKAPAATLPRDLTVLFDASGSMGGAPIDTAKRVAEALLESLDEGDRFEVIAFAHKTRPLTRGMEAASPKAIHRAVSEVRALSADGGTEMVTAFEKALAPLRRDSQRQIVLITDGQIGFEDELIRKMGAKLPSGVRVHVVGIGSAVNRTLTTMVARLGRGVELIAEGVSAADEAGRRIRGATARPVLTEVRVRGSALKALVPEYPRDVFAGQPLVVAAELRPEGGTLEVTASLAGSKDEWRWRTDVPAADAADPAGSTPIPIGALYGREVIADTEAHPNRAGTPEKMNETVEALGMRHRIVSRRTSLVAVAEEPSVDPLAPRRRERLAVELPAGVSAEGVGLGATGYYRGVPLMAKSITLGTMRPQARGWLPWGLRPGDPDEGEFDATRVLSAPRVYESDSEEAPTVLLSGEVIRIDGPELILEVEVPDGGLVLPRTEVDLRFPKVKAKVIKVITEHSSTAGPHPSGSRVRLSVRLDEGDVWPADVAVLEWPAPSGAGNLARFVLVVNIATASRPRTGA